MRTSTLIFVLFVVTVFVSSAGTAAAQDLVGETGTVVGVTITTPSSDTSLQYHGQVFVQKADKSVVEYRWGGSSCGSRILTDAEEGALHRALDSKVMRIRTLYQDGQGNAQCVVGFTLVPKKYVAAVIP
jgi:hypothetical protein